jgi:hypothetical protein
MIAARFHELRNRVIGAADRVFAEPVRLSPMKNGRTDTTRPQHVLEAVLRVGKRQDTTATGATGSSAQDWKSRFSAATAELHIDRATYDGPRVEPGDKIRALSRHGEPVWTVMAIDDRSHTRLVLVLGEV